MRRRCSGGMGEAGPAGSTIAVWAPRYAREREGGRGRGGERGGERGSTLTERVLNQQDRKERTHVPAWLRRETRGPNSGVNPTPAFRWVLPYETEWGGVTRNAGIRLPPELGGQP